MRSLALVALGSLLPLLATGCGAHTQLFTSPVTGSALTGHVHGGLQPVSGATIQLYATSVAGDGAAATPLLQQPVITDAHGGFSITGNYTCPSPYTLVYLTATGGNPGLPGAVNNRALALLAALGPCGNLTPTSFISLNELTTVAALGPLAPFASGYAAISSTTSDQTALASAFTEAEEMVSIASGSVASTSAGNPYTNPAAQLDTLANIIAACINSTGGTAGDSSPCGLLFSAAQVTGQPAPQDTVAALLAIAQQPSTNPASIFRLAPSTGVYQPTLASAPASWALSPFTSGTSSLPDRPHLLAEYLLSAGSGAVATDTSGLGNDGQISGAFWEGTLDLGFYRGDYISTPPALNQTNTWQFALYSPPYGNLSYPFPPGAIERGVFTINPSLLCGSDTAHSCLINNNYPGSASQRFWAFNTSGTQALQPLTPGWHIVTLVNGQNGTPDRIYYDGVEVAYQSQGSGMFTHPSSGSYQIGGSGAYFDTWFTGKIAGVWAWSSSLSPADVVTSAQGAHAFLQAKGAQFTFPNNPHTTPLVIGGIDSRTYGAFMPPYLAWINQLALSDPAWSTLDMGTNGSSLWDHNAMYGLNEHLQIAANTAPTIVILWGGVNDFIALPNISAETIVDSMKSLVVKAKADGARVIVATEIDSNFGGGPRDAIDTAIRANALSWGADNVADLATIPQLGADNAHTSTTWFVDGVHPTTTAEPLITAVMSNAVNELIGSTASSPHTTAASTYTELAGDRFLQLTGSAAQSITLPSCIGYSLPRQVTNLGPVTAGLGTQNGEALTGNPTISPGATAILMPVPGALSTGGCSWQRN